MYLAIITLPLLGSIAAGFFGRKLGVSGAQLITCSCVIVTTLLAVLTFFEVGLNNIPVSINLFRWIDSESVNVLWGFHFDSLTVSMLIPVLIVSSLVHIYSIGYMSHDPRGRVRGKRVYGDKLSNSGDILKLKVPSYSRKAISGWTNYSGTVTSLNMSENEMDNRGSKSTIFLVWTIFLVLVSLLISALSSFISFILSLPHFKVLLFSNSSLLAIFPLRSRASGFNRRNFSYTLALSVDVRNSGAGLLREKSPLLFYRRPTKSVGGFRGYSTNSLAVAALIFSSQPVKIYKNADLAFGWSQLKVSLRLDKVRILQEDKGKCGVYRWTNLTNGNSYIGSSVNLERRLKGYFSIYLLESEIKNGRSMINSALLKYGYSNFTLEILEYCDSSEVVTREQYYLDLFKPEYNILSTAGSWLGSKHSEEAKAKMSAVKKGNQNARGGKGRKRAEGAVSPSVPVEVFDQETGMKTIYPSMSEVGKGLGVPSGSIRMYFSSNTQKPYKGRYFLQKLAGYYTRGFHTMVVKEQRVDGSWSIKPDLMDLRCTLWGFERKRGIKLGFNMQQGWNSYVKDPSKQFGLKKFSTYNSTIVNPGVWSGLIDGEGSFSIIVDRNKTRKSGWRVQLKFQIGLHIKDLNLLYLLQQYLGGIGFIHLARNREIVNYSIDSIEDLNKLIIHLEKYPLLTQKAADFLLFKQVVKLVNNKAHLTVEGLNQIVNIKASMNLGLSDMLKSEFAGYTPVERPVINSDNVILDPHWISGFVSAEGNFDVRIPSTNSKLGYRVQLRFRITQHSRDLRLMEKIVEYFGSGKIYKYGGKSAVSLTIVDFTGITNIIVPFFNKNPIIGIKLYDYLDWCKIHSLMINRSNLTVEGINSIREIKSGMNIGRSFEDK
jgi:LAGLIDADG DNA endonuclease family protein/NADH-ubiquinone oxidoreductase (complex I) subunit 5/GIY-YIG catalytic domain-containing protein